MAQPTACSPIIIRNKATLAGRIITDSWRRPDKLAERPRTLSRMARENLETENDESERINVPQSDIIGTTAVAELDVN